LSGALYRNVPALRGRSFSPLGTGNSDTLTEAAKKMEGYYLYFDREEGVWIRSGKASGRNFAEHHKEHKKKLST
jgi:hypothetical protein